MDKQETNAASENSSDAAAGGRSAARPCSALVALSRGVWVPCYEYCLSERSHLMFLFIWCVLARIDPERRYYAPLFPSGKWKCRRCGKTFKRCRPFSTTTHEESECTNQQNSGDQPPDACGG